MSLLSVRRLLHDMGYSLPAPSKQNEGSTHPDRDGQFNHLNAQAAERLAAGDPVISVDTKNKELIGRYANGGTEWQTGGEPERVNVHDFADRALGQFAKAIPYAVYDIGNDEGWINVGDTADTAEFAVNSIRRWWNTLGKTRFPDATRLMITADCGGSNGYRTRAWKWHLAKLAAETGLEIAVCHYPPGISKWNKIEHRLFSFVSMNWRGRRRCRDQRGGAALWHDRHFGAGLASSVRGARRRGCGPDCPGTRPQVVVAGRDRRRGRR